MEDPWWFKSLGEEFGPISLADLASAARNGALTASDAVKQGARGPWRRADSVRELAALCGSFGTTGIARVVDVPGSATGPLQTENLERLILNVLAEPIDGPVKPSLDELGLTQATSSSGSDFKDEALDTAPAASLVPQRGPRLISGIAWTRLNPFRNLLPGTDDRPIETEIVKSWSIAPGQPSRAADLAAAARGDSKPEIGDATVRAPNVRWPELLILAGGTALLFQIFPRAMWALVGFVDVRTWTFRELAIASVIAVLVVVGANAWENR